VLEGVAFAAATQVNYTANAAASTTHDSFSLFHTDIPEEAEKGLHRLHLKTTELAYIEHEFLWSGVLTINHTLTNPSSTTDQCQAAGGRAQSHHS
jgi:hypothetical protein